MTNNDTSPATTSEPFDVHELLAKLRQIAVIWSVEDVQEMRPDLTDDQAWEVLQAVKRRHDAEIGINWLTLEAFADAIFPETIDQREV
jgi:hypothetical protein